MSASGVIRYLLRLPRDLHEAVQAIAEREHRSLNAQIVYILERFVAEDRGEEPDAGKAAA